MLAMAGVSGRAGTEDDRSPGGHRGDVENATLALADRGVRSSIIRLSPLVHSDLDKHGFGPILIGIARDKGFAGYPGEGSNRLARRPHARRREASTAARSSRRPPARPARGRRRGRPPSEIAEAIGRGTGLEVEAVPEDGLADYFGFLACSSPWTTRPRTR